VFCIKRVLSLTIYVYISVKLVRTATLTFRVKVRTKNQARNITTLQSARHVLDECFELLVIVYTCVVGKVRSEQRVKSLIANEYRAWWINHLLHL